MSEKKQTIDERIQYLQNELNSKRNDGYTEKGLKEELNKLLKIKNKQTPPRQFIYMYNKIATMWNIFKNDNEWNEKTVVGFIAFIVMVCFALLDLITGYLGKDLVINETIYDSFTWIVIGCFGIAGVEKFAKK